MELLSCNTEGYHPRLHPRSSAIAWATEQHCKLVRKDVGVATLHITGGRESRCWPAQCFVELAHWLRTTYALQPVLIGRPSENDRLAAVAGAIPGATWITPPNLETAAAWLAGSTLVVGNDSGIVHMAVAVGTPVVAIFGPGEHQHWGYWNLPRYQMVRLQLPCWPCYRSTCGKTPCLARLPVSDVAVAVKQVLIGTVD
jgi:ADP-heptose:LPS heptosyltransferase